MMGTKTTKGKRKSGPLKLASRQKEVAEMYMTGMRQSDIAVKVGVSTSMVCNYIKAFHLQLKAEGLVDVEEKFYLELARIDKIESEAWDAWQRSKVDGYEKTTTKQRPWLTKKDREDGKTLAKQAMVAMMEIERETKQIGDVTFLRVAYDCCVLRLKLLGKLSPREEKGQTITQVNINWGDLATPIPNVDVIDVTPSTSVENRIAAELQGTPS